MSRKRWLLIFTLLLVTLASGTVAQLAQGRHSETESGLSTPTMDPATGLDPNYDDSWVANIPATISGFKVLYVSTPKNRACSFTPEIHLQTAHDTVEQFLGQVDGGSVLRDIRAIQGVPANVMFSVAGPHGSTEMIRSFIAERNAETAALGCPERFGSTELETIQP